MAGTINIMGKPVNKTVVFAGAGIILIGGIYLYRKEKNNSANAATNAAVDSASTEGDAGIDPATGYAYGSAYP